MTASPDSRVGIVVPKHGHSAVRRNQLKRALRELARLVILSALRARSGAPEMDVVMRARPSAYGASHEMLQSEIETVKGQLLRLRDASSTPNASVARSPSAS